MTAPQWRLFAAVGLGEFAVKQFNRIDVDFHILVPGERFLRYALPQIVRHNAFVLLKEILDPDNPCGLRHSLSFLCRRLYYQRNADNGADDY